MTKSWIVIAVAVCLMGGTALAKAKPAAPAPAKAAAAAPALAPEEATSALFFSTCVVAEGSRDAFDKTMQNLEKTKRVAKLAPDSLKNIDPDETKDAWGSKGLADASKPLLMTYNVAKNICGMHVSDIPADKLRYAFQADLKKWVDLKKAKYQVAKPQVSDEKTLLAIEINANGKTSQLMFGTDKKTGETFLAIHY